jgi:hypothetical protein
MIAHDIAADLTGPRAMTNARTAIVVTNDGTLMNDRPLRRGLRHHGSRREPGERDKTGGGECKQLHESLLIGRKRERS